MKVLLRLLPLGVLPVTALGFLCLPALPDPAGPYSGSAPVGSFVPSVSVAVSPTTAGAPGTLTFTLSVPQGDLLPAGVAIFVPAQWGVAFDTDVTDGLGVGSLAGTFTASNEYSGDTSCLTEADFAADLADATTNTSSPSYPSYLNAVAPGTHKARYYGEADIESLATVPVNVLVDELGDGRDQIVLIVGDPTSAAVFGANAMCAPWSFTLTLLGTTTTGGQNVYVNPPQGTYTLQAIVASELDADNDGFGNQIDNCPQTANAAQMDTDLDWIGDDCDAEPWTAQYDADGDTAPNGFDNCPLTANESQADSDLDDLGDACDPGIGSPTRTRYVLDCQQDVFIGVAGSDTASCSNLATSTPTPTPTSTPIPDIDGDGIPNADDNCPEAANLSQEDGDGDDLGDACEADYGTNPALADSDGDGCYDGREVRVFTFSLAEGGDRDPLAAWDFYDVPTPALRLNPSGARDKGIGITTDLVALLSYAGLGSGHADYLADYDGNGVADGLQYDRSPSTTPGKPWRSGPPDGGVGVTTDVVAILAQSGHTCAAPP